MYYHVQECKVEEATLAHLVHWVPWASRGIQEFRGHRATLAPLGTLVRRAVQECRVLQETLVFKAH